MISKTLKKASAVGLSLLTVANTGVFGAIVENESHKLKSKERVVKRVEPAEEKGAWYYTKKIGSAVFQIGILGGLVVTNRAFAPVVFNGVRLVLDKDEIMIPLIFCASFGGASFDGCLRKVYLQQTCKTTDELKAKLEKMWTFNLRSLSRTIQFDAVLFESDNPYEKITETIQSGTNFLSPLKKVLEKDGKEKFNAKLNKKFIEFDQQKLSTLDWDETVINLITEILEQREKEQKKED